MKRTTSSLIPFHGKTERESNYRYHDFVLATEPNLWNVHIKKTFRESSLQLFLQLC